MNDVHLNAMNPQPPRQPKAVPSRLIGEGNGPPFGLSSPPLIASAHQPQQRIGIGSSFFRGRRSTPGTIPVTSQLASLISTTTVRLVS
jgi:hypothetical protein